MKNVVIRVIAAICFLPLFISSVRTPFTGGTIQYGNAWQIAVSFIPALVILLIIVGILTGKPVVSGVGAAIYAIVYILTISSLFQAYASMKGQGFPETTVANIRNALISNVLLILAFLFLALGCFIRKRGNLLCMISAGIFLVRAVQRQLMLRIEAPAFSIILNSVALIAGTVLIGRYLAAEKEEK